MPALITLTPVDTATLARAGRAPALLIVCKDERELEAVAKFAATLRQIKGIYSDSSAVAHFDREKKRNHRFVLCLDLLDLDAETILQVQSDLMRNGVAVCPPEEAKPVIAELAVGRFGLQSKENFHTQAIKALGADIKERIKVIQGQDIKANGTFDKYTLQFPAELGLNDFLKTKYPGCWLAAVGIDLGTAKSGSSSHWYGYEANNKIVFSSRVDPNSNAKAARGLDRKKDELPSIVQDTFDRIIAEVAPFAYFGQMAARRDSVATVQATGAAAKPAPSVNRRVTTTSAAAAEEPEYVRRAREMEKRRPPT